MNSSLFSVLHAGFTRNPDATALWLPDAGLPDGGPPDGARVSYAELNCRVDDLCHHLASLGLRADDRVAVQVEKSPAALALYLAILKSGAVYLPLNTAYKGAEIAYFLQDAEPRIFICDPARELELAPLAKAAHVQNISTLDANGEGSLMNFVPAAAAFPEVHRDAEDLAALLYTSGTTGRSKGAMMSHRALSSNVRTLAKLWQMQANDVLLHALPMFHTHGLFVACGTALLSGAAMIFLPRFEPTQILSLLPKASVMMGVPTFYSRLLEQPGFDAKLCRAMRLFISGSAPLLPETWQEFKCRTGHEILERYGMTESGMNSSNPYIGERLPGTVGLPLPGVEIRLQQGEEPAPLGEVGEIQLRGENLFSGYWRNAAKTAEDMLEGGWFKTGDLGQFNQNGYLSIVGRAKDLVISGGFNVYPREVEEILNAVSGVVESAVFGVPHPDFGEAVVAALVLNPKLTNLPTEESIIQIVKASLANYKVPKLIFMLESLPRNAMGKVEKATLRSRYKDQFLKS